MLASWPLLCHPWRQRLHSRGGLVKGCQRPQGAVRGFRSVVLIATYTPGNLRHHFASASAQAPLLSPQRNASGVFFALGGPSLCHESKQKVPPQAGEQMN